MRPHVTMFADASVFADRKKSGWGFWIKGDNRDSMSAGGPIEVFSPFSEVAELDAIANGLTCAEAAGYFRETDGIIMIQSDSAAALAIVKAIIGAAVNSHAESAPIPNRKKPLTAHQTDTVERIRGVITRHSLSVQVRHVRGHKAGGGRNWVNDLCDKLAKRGAFQTRKAA